MEQQQLKQELIQLLYPLFTHLYIQLLVSCPGRRPQCPAHSFLKDHVAIFLINEEFKKFITQLYEATEAKDLDNNPDIVTFRATKYTVTLTEQTYKVCFTTNWLRWGDVNKNVKSETFPAFDALP